MPRYSTKIEFKNRLAPAYFTTEADDIEQANAKAREMCRKQHPRSPIKTTSTTIAWNADSVWGA